MTIVRNVLAIVLGFVAGSIVNMGLVVGGTALVPPPEGMNPMDAESVKAHIHLFTPANFAVPFLAHALGTLVGALVAFLVAATRRSLFAFIVGGLFLVGGIAAAFMIPAPGWFLALDILVAYLPMAWLATAIGDRLRPS